MWILVDWNLGCSGVCQEKCIKKPCALSSNHSSERTNLSPLEHFFARITKFLRQFWKASMVNNQFFSVFFLELFTKKCLNKALMMGLYCPFREHVKASGVTRRQVPSSEVSFLELANPMKELLLWNLHRILNNRLISEKITKKTDGVRQTSNSPPKKKDKHVHPQIDPQNLWSFSFCILDDFSWRCFTIDNADSSWVHPQSPNSVESENQSGTWPKGIKFEC